MFFYILFIVASILIFSIFIFKRKINYNFKNSIKYKVIKEFNNIKIVSKGIGPNTNVYPKCKILLTDKHLIIQQKSLFGNKYSNIFFLFYELIPDKKIGLIGITQSGYFSLNDIKIVNTTQKKYLEIDDIKGAINLKNIRIYTEKPEILESAIKTIFDKIKKSK